MLRKQSSAFLITLKPSKKITILIMASHALALVCCFANALPLRIQFAAALIVVFDLAWACRTKRTECRQIKCTDQGLWQISYGGDFVTVEIMGSTVITTTFIFLHLKNKPPIVIANDALSASEYRQLAVKLKMTVA